MKRVKVNGYAFFSRIIFEAFQEVSHMQTRKFAQIAGLLVLAGVITALVGCVEGEYSYVIYPDGSGKVIISAKTTPPFPLPPQQMKEQLEAAKKQALQMSPFRAYSGIYLNPNVFKVELVEGKIYQHIELVFEDISKVTDANGKPLGSLTVLENGDFKLTLTPPSDMDKLNMPGGEVSEVTPQMEEMMKNMLKGLKFTTSLKMPGEIKTTPLPDKQGRLTSLTVTEEDFLNKEKRETITSLVKTLEVVCGPVTDEAVKAEHEEFKKELPAIIEASKKFMEELKKEEAAEEEEEEEKEEEEGEEGNEEEKGG